MGDISGSITELEEMVGTNGPSHSRVTTSRNCSRVSTNSSRNRLTFSPSSSRDTTSSNHSKHTISNSNSKHTTSSSSTTVSRKQIRILMEHKETGDGQSINEY